jgi:adenylate kinase family enzyme
MADVRVVIVGTSGCGKSTLARSIARELSIAHICNDSLLWMPNWTLRPKPEFHALLLDATARDSWTFDGNLRIERAPDRRVLDRATHLVWLDLPFHVVMRQLLFRTIRRAWTREVIFSENRESWRLSFFSRDSILLWGWTQFDRYRARYQRLFDHLRSRSDSPVLVHIRDPRQLARWRSRFAVTRSLSE